MPKIPTGFRWRLKLTLAVFIILSLGLHLFFGVGSIATEKLMDHLAEERAQRLAIEAVAKKKRAAQAKVEQAQATRQQLRQELKEKYKQVVAGKINDVAADHLWDQIVDDMDTSIDAASDAMDDQSVSDSDAEQQLDQLQGQMYDEMAKQFGQMRIHELADDFVSHVKTDVAPRVADYQRQQIASNVGVFLRNQGGFLIQQDMQQVKSQRGAVAAALGQAQGLVKAAQSNFNAASQKLANLPKSSAAAAAQTAAAAAALTRAQSQLASAQKLLQSAAASDNNLSDSVRGAVRAAATQPSASAAQARADAARQALQAATQPSTQPSNPDAKAMAAARQAAAKRASTSAQFAAVDTGKFLDAIRAAASAVGQDSRTDPDGGNAARLAAHDARDQQIKKLLDDSFSHAAATQAIPRLADRLTGAFQDVLSQAGVNDPKTVADVRQRVGQALGESMQTVNAGNAGTNALTHLADLDRHLTDHWHGTATTQPSGTPSNVASATTLPSGSWTAAATAPSVSSAAPATRPDRQAAFGQKMQRLGQQAADQVLPAVANDATHDSQFVAAAMNNNHGDADTLADLQMQSARYAANARGGHLDLPDGANQPVADGDNGGGSGNMAPEGQGAAGSGDGSGFGRLLRFHRSLTHGGSLHGGFTGGSRFDASQYNTLTQGIHSRDTAAAQGEAIDLQGAADAPTADIAALAADAKARLFPAMLLVPTVSADQPAPAAVAEHKDPYHPTFASIRFASIPYRSKPITIDGDLSEWSDVPALPMSPAGPAAHINGAVTFPQQIKMQWDNTGFYIAAELKKANPRIVKVDTGNFWEGDGIEVFVDTLNSKQKMRTDCSHQFWAWVAGSLKDPNEVGGENYQIGGRSRYIPYTSEQMTVAGRQTPDGWTMEVFIPKERFRQLRLEPGVIIGLNFSYCTGGPLYYYWAGSTEIGTSVRPDTWGDVLLAGSDAKLECVDRLASELKQTETAKNLACIHIGQPLRIRVTDPVMNLSDTVKDRVSVTVKSAHGEPRDVILVETGEKTGIFEGAIPTALETGDNLPDVLTLYEGEEVEVAYIDQCRPDGARNVKMTLKLPTAAGIAETGK